MTVDSLQKQIPGSDGHLFKKGRSGNPAGRPPGSRNRSTLAAEILLEGEAEALTRRAIELALEGDTTALKLCLERIVPQRKSRAVSFDLPPIERVEDLAGAIGSVLQEASCGRLLLDEAAALVGMMESKRRAMETIDLEQRLERKRQPAGETFYVWINTLVRETQAQAIARRFPDGVPPGAKLVTLRWLTDEDP